MIRSVPKYFLWLKYLSWLNYSNQALLINQWLDVEKIECKEYAFRCLKTGENILDHLHIDKVSYYFNFFSGLNKIIDQLIFCLIKNIVRL